MNSCGVKTFFDKIIIILILSSSSLTFLAESIPFHGKGAAAPAAARPAPSPFPSSRGKNVLRAAFQEAAGCAAPLSVASRSALPACFLSALVLRWDRARWGVGSKGPFLVRVSSPGHGVRVGRGGGGSGRKRLRKPSALRPASAASEPILGSYTTPARGRML